MRIRIKQATTPKGQIRSRNLMELSGAALSFGATDQGQQRVTLHMDSDDGRGVQVSLDADTIRRIQGLATDEQLIQELRRRGVVLKVYD